MRDVLTRADALLELLSSDVREPARLALVDSVISCCEDLCALGEAEAALRLLERYTSEDRPLGPESAVRLDLARVRALNRGSHLTEALTLARRVLSERSQALLLHPIESYKFRILEAATLWRLSRAQEAIDRLLAIRRELLGQPDSALLASCGLHLQSAHIISGDYAQARAFGLEAIVSARRCGDRYLEAIALSNHGRLERNLCRWATALEATTEALAAFESIGNKYEIITSRRSLAITLLKRGRTLEALAAAEKCYRAAVEIDHKLLSDYAGLLLCLIRLHQGNLDAAERIAREVLGPDGAHTDARIHLLAVEFAGDCHLERGNPGAALDSYGRAWSKALALVPKGDIVAELRRRRAECYYLLGRHEEAYAEAKAGLEHCRELGDRYEEAATYRVLALSAAAVGKADEAKKWFDQGFAYYDDIETPYEWGKLWMAYGDWLLGLHAGAHADRKGALEAYYAARDHFERMGAEAKLAEVNARLEKLVEPKSSGAVPGAQVAEVTAADVRHTPRRPRRSTELERRSAWAFETFGMVTRNKAMLALLGDVAKLAPSDTPILVLGESGTGKELVAQGIHALSERKGPFMAINAGSLPREIIESELFGHILGAFTGATRDKPGIFEVCDQGTVFLDEIAEMSFELQSRLLRFLETGESRRVGSSRNIAVDTRIITATNREHAALEKGEGFRLDLYYRLAHAVIALPPLRRRGDDVEMLVAHFLEEACSAARKRVHLSPAALSRLVSYSWPGNIRQLRAVLKRVVLLGADGHEVAPEELQLENADVPTTLIEELEQAERRRVAEAISQARGSRTEAARLLGMPRTTLINKLRRYGLK